MTTPAYSSRRNTERRSISNVGLGTTGLSHTVGHIDDTRAAVVIEFGRVTTKCGYAGDYTPRRICRTEYFDENGIVRQDVLDGYENAKRPNDAALQRFFKLLYFTHLLVEPRERRVVLVENILYPTEFRHALCRVLMDKMDVPSVLFLPSHLCATFPFNTENALVLELGFKESLVIPVALGVSLLNSHEISSIAEKRLQERLAELLLAHGTITGHHDDSRRISEEDMMKIRERNLLEDICTRLLYCSSRERGLLIQEKAHEAELNNPKPRDANVNLDGETLVIPGFIREAACEVFFVNDSPDEPALPHLIFNAIMKVPIDLRRQMFSSLLVTGGPALRLGFLGRLKEELLALGVEMKQKAASTIKFHRFQNEPGTELYLNWLGGAMFGSIRDALACRSVSRELWQEKHRIPDWTDFVQYNVRSGRTDMQG